MFPKPTRGSGSRARRARKKKLNEHRKKVNLQVLERDGCLCQHCFALGVHAHHLYGRGNSPEHEFESCEKRLSLCDPCHDAVHHRGTITREDLIKDLERALKYDSENGGVG